MEIGRYLVLVQLEVTELVHRERLVSGVEERQRGEPVNKPRHRVTVDQQTSEEQARSLRNKKRKSVPRMYTQTSLSASRPSATVEGKEEYALKEHNDGTNEACDVDGRKRGRQE
jgi:hypothetical protein